jgi:RNA recognition motif. (a.k.a. RRM, RBD, or RNP domain)
MCTCKYGSNQQRPCSPLLVCLSLSLSLSLSRKIRGAHVSRHVSTCSLFSRFLLVGASSLLYKCRRLLCSNVERFEILHSTQEDQLSERSSVGTVEFYIHLSAASKMSGTRIFVGKLAPATTERDLEEEFAHYGKVERVDVKKDKGFAFVIMTDAQEADDAIAGLNGKEIHGNPIVVEAGRPGGGPRGSGTQSSGKGNPELRVVCYGVNDSTSWQDLKDWGRSDGGNVTYANVFVKDSQKIGVVEFETVEEAQRALQKLGDIPCKGANLRLEKVKTSGD